MQTRCLNDSDSENESTTDDDVPTHTLDHHTCNKANTDDLIQEQINDPTLTGFWSLARKGKGGYYIKNDMLFHLGTVAGQNCEQLCVPTVRRPHTYIHT